MKDYKIATFLNHDNTNQLKKTGPKTKAFGYQILGFGSGGGVGPPYDIEVLVVGGGGGGGGVVSVVAAELEVTVPLLKKLQLVLQLP